MKNKGKKFSFLYALYICLLAFGFSYDTATAAHFSGGFSSGNITYVVANGSNRSIAQTAVAQWNGKSSRAGISSASPTNPRRVTTRFNAHRPPTSGALGLMSPFKSGGARASTSERWATATVYQYTNSLLNTTAKRTATATHELGHALSVAHPPSTNSTAQRTAVMRQGVKTSSTLTSYDTGSLIAKWGR